MLFTPEQFIMLGAVLLGGLLIGYACAPSPRKWKRRVREQSESFTEHYTALEEQLRAANRRVDDLTVQGNALRADHIEAERTIGSLRAAAMAAPVAASVAAVSEKPLAPLTRTTEAPVMAEPEAIATREVPRHPAPAVAEEPETAADADGRAPERAVAEQGHVKAVSDVASPPVPETDRREAVGETATSAPAYGVEQVADETPEGAPPTGDTFPVAEDADPPREAAAALPAHPAPTAETVLSREPVVEHDERTVEAPMTPVATDAPPAPIGPAEAEMPSKGWFASSARDDLTRIRGIDGVLNTRLFSLGVVRFEDLEKLSAEDEMALEQRLALPVGYIAREQWRTQSALLRAGQTEEHAAHFGAEPVAVG